jgi:hypothetical protein
MLKTVFDFTPGIFLVLLYASTLITGVALEPIFIVGMIVVQALWLGIPKAAWHLGRLVGDQGGESGSS